MMKQLEISYALKLSGFDSEGAQRNMAPIPRTMLRPQEKPGMPLIGAVLLMLYQKKNGTHLLLTKRHESLTYHPGQISFPGGRRKDNEPLLTTALRETHEEVGVPPEELTALGELKSVYIPASDFEIFPFVAWHKSGPVFLPSTEEVSAILEVKLNTLFDNKNKDMKISTTASGSIVRIPYFKVLQHKVWGATAMILSELLERLKACSTDS
jgi:8-oxo-dGTP pyrophosphatase MutT (NUDIX family)